MTVVALVYLTNMTEFSLVFMMAIYTRQMQVCIFYLRFHML